LVTFLRPHLGDLSLGEEARLEAVHCEAAGKQGRGPEKFKDYLRGGDCAGRLLL